MTSEAKDNSSWGQEPPELRQIEPADANVKADEALQPLPEKEKSTDVDETTDGQIFQVAYEAIMSGDNLGLVETPMEVDEAPPLESDLAAQDAVKVADTSLESQVDDQAPIPLNQVENDSDQSDATEDEIEKETEVANATLQNGNSSSEKDVQVALSIDNLSVSEDNLTLTPTKEEKKGGEFSTPVEGRSQSFTFHHFLAGDDSGSEEEQTAFMKELESFYKERSMEFKPPKFYGEGINCLKLWREVTRLGGYEQVTTCKLWRQVGESFRPPKTCTTVSWTFRNFYEKALLEYEKHKIQTGELKVPASSLSDTMGVDNQVSGNQTSGSGRARRDAAARAMQGWHSQRLLGYGEVGDPIIKDKNSLSLVKRDRNLKNLGSPKKRKVVSLEHLLLDRRGDIVVADVGNPADWVKINVRRTKDCFEVYALVPGLLREEVQVQSDPAGRLIISGQPEQPDNPWGVTQFKKVITLPSRIDPHQTSAVVTLHGQLLVRAPF